MHAGPARRAARVAGARLSPRPTGVVPLPGFGARLRRLRRARDVKQDHVARLAGVDQATVSRWERGEAHPSRARADAVLRALRPARVDDAALRRLVESSTLTVHLVTDVDHLLLAASPAREAEWGVAASALRGRSLWPAASPGILAAETALEAQGWWESVAPAPVTLDLENHDGGFLPIVAGRMTWERVWLADGRPARLCTLLGSAREASDSSAREARRRDA